ncbi:MAG: crossover junction endodeoxyribonuclease RuvC [Ruminococcus sp.]|nr:crossover junction endodeoxyribonuclease RuvC [Ruminococcus sp.]
MRILGIDPGYAIVGYGVIDTDGSRMKLAGAGAVTTPADMEFYQRLRTIYLDMGQLLEYYRPDQVSIENLYSGRNVTTVINVAQARGVILLPMIMKGLPIFEYTPRQAKNVLTGYGEADKRQMQEMTRNLLHLKETIKPDDAADAVALAITHAFSVNTRKLISRAEKK